MPKKPDRIHAQLAESRRNQILDAATELFAKKGFHAATVREIAREAGIADGTVYIYFKTKPDLFLGILNRLNERERLAVDQAQHLNGEVRVRHFFADHLRQRMAAMDQNLRAFQAVLPDLLMNPELRERYLHEVLEPGFRRALLPALRRRNALTVKRQLFRRSPDACRLFARIWAEEGLRGFGRVLLFVLGLYRDPKLAARFRELGALPKGTVGRTYFDDFQARKLAFPGERGGMPERMVHHDFMHVINRYGTDAAGECELAGFYAGFTPGDSFTFIMIVLATFQLGMPVSPAAVTPARLAFDPARVVAAFLRGRRLRVDVMGQWNYWELVPLSIDEAQARLGLAEVTRDS